MTKLPRNGLRTVKQFKEAVVQWAAQIKVEPTQIRLQKMTRKWASCSTSGWVCFSMDLLQERRDFQEYVIVHELLHLQVPNHGRLFKSLLRAYLPEWEAIVGRRANKSERDV
jgi:predicted metal-dependent hydrolase